MKYGYLGFGLVMFGMLGLVIIVMFEAVTVDNDSQYYVLKEAMQASMYESIDQEAWANQKYYQICKYNGKQVKISKLKIVEQKFVENFTRRFAAGIGGDASDYKIEFYDIMESPPKATIKITSNTKSYKVVSGDEGINMVNNLTGILVTDCY